MTDIPFISIIIPSYNRAKLLGLAIESFIEQTYPSDRYEIIVADNNSQDYTREVVLEWQAKSSVALHYFFEKRQGVHYARNSAAKIAKGDILYFTDDDMVADKALLKEIVSVFNLDPLIGSATGKIIGKFVAPPPRWVKKDLINEYLSLTEEGKPEELVISRNDLVFSCHEAVKRDVFFQCGGFNPENTAGEWIGDGETGLGIKMKQAGYRFAYTSRSVIYHIIPKSRMTLQYFIKRMGNQGYCDAFTEYRTHRSRNKILFLMIKRNTIGIVRLFGFIIVRIAAGKNTWRYLPAITAYMFKRNAHDIKLYRDKEFRKLAEIDDWLQQGSNSL